MYKDFKKTESLDTGFVGGSGIIWMFSGIVIGLLVGLGMYYFSNLNTSDSLNATEMSQASEQKNIKQSDQTATSSLAESAKQEPADPAQMDNLSIVDQADKNQQAAKKKNDTNFSYYAVLPKLDVPVGSIKAVDIRESARDSANIAQVSTTKKGNPSTANETAKSSSKGKNKASIKAGKGKYYLQIASFKRKSSANVALRGLAKRGVKASIQKKKIKGRLWYRIGVGSLDKATAYRWKKIAEKIGHKPRISQ